MPNWGGGPIYDSCDGYYGNECPSFVVPFVGRLDKRRAGRLLTATGALERRPFFLDWSATDFSSRLTEQLQIGQSDMDYGQ